MKEQSIFADTDPQAEAFLVEHLRALSPRRKWHMVSQLNATVRHLALAGLRARFPNANERTLHRYLASLLSEDTFVGEVAKYQDDRRSYMPLPEPLDVTLQVARVLDALDVPYFITGSLASALYGVARTTQDADIVARLEERHVEPLVKALEGEFYIAEEAVRAAVRSARSFNVIHLATMFKVDIFVRRDAFDDARLRRRVAHTVGTTTEAKAYFASPEDVVLAKLAWYRKGGEVATQQWRDVLGVLKVWGPNMDIAYMREWASRLGVDDLLEQAWAAAGVVSKSQGIGDTSQ